MRWEIQRYYPDEYAVGLQAAQIIREALSVSFAEDEAAFMALHFVNAETGIEIGQMYEVTELIHASVIWCTSTSRWISIRPLWPTTVF